MSDLSAEDLLKQAGLPVPEVGDCEVDSPGTSSPVVREDSGPTREMNGLESLLTSRMKGPFVPRSTNLLAEIQEMAASEKS